MTVPLSLSVCLCLMLREQYVTSVSVSLCWCHCLHLLPCLRLRCPSLVCVCCLGRYSTYLLVVYLIRGILAGIVRMLVMFVWIVVQVHAWTVQFSRKHLSFPCCVRPNGASGNECGV